jgi:hypothetical protein
VPSGSGDVAPVSRADWTRAEKGQSFRATRPPRRSIVRAVSPPSLKSDDSFIAVSASRSEPLSATPSSRARIAANAIDKVSGIADLEAVGFFRQSRCHSESRLSVCPPRPRLASVVDGTVGRPLPARSGTDGARPSCFLYYGAAPSRANDPRVRPSAHGPRCRRARLGRPRVGRPLPARSGTDGARPSCFLYYGAAPSRAVAPTKYVPLPGH